MSFSATVTKAVSVNQQGNKFTLDPNGDGVIDDEEKEIIEDHINSIKETLDEHNITAKGLKHILENFTEEKAQKVFDDCEDDIEEAIKDYDGNLTDVLAQHNLTKEDLGDGIKQLARKCLFLKAAKFVEKLSSRNGTTAKFALNHFALLSQDEIKEKYTGFKAVETGDESETLVQTQAQQASKARLLNSNTPNIDWVGSAIPEQVLNQGACGGCWAFAASEAIGAQSYLRNKSSPSLVLSPQQLISCNTGGFNMGCGGGNSMCVWGDCNTQNGLSVAYTPTNPLTTNAAYPYTDGGSGQTSSCNTEQESTGIVYAATNVRVGAFNGGVTPTNDEIYEALSEQPMTIAIYASNPCFQFYNGGTLTEGDCNDEMTGNKCKIDHAIMIVGVKDYGTKNAVWKVKNSWGTGWGEGGYAYFQIIDQSDISSGKYDCPGLLSINTQVAYPKLAAQDGAIPEAAVQPSFANQNYAPIFLATLFLWHAFF